MERSFRAACYNGDEDYVLELMFEGVDIKSKDEIGRDGLIWAAENGKVNIVRLMMTFPAPGDINQAEDFGHSALHVASCKGRIDVVQELLNNGIKTDVKNNKGNTAVEMAERRKHHEIVRLIEKHEGRRAPGCLGSSAPKVFFGFRPVAPKGPLFGAQNYPFWQRGTKKTLFRGPKLPHGFGFFWF